MKGLVGFVAVSSLVGFGANAATVRKVQFSGQDRIEIGLDEALSAKQVRTEFLRDIIQITLEGATVYPARIVPAAQSERLLKVFAYQYSPRQVRIRISTRGPSQTYRPEFELSRHGRSWVASLKPVERAQTPVVDAVVSTASRVSEPELLKKIESKQEAHPTQAPLKVAQTVSPLPSFGKVLVGLLLAVAGIVALLLGIKRLQKVAEKSQKKMQGFFARMGLAKKVPMIEVVSSQALGPKKTISVVKVQGRLLVLGIAQDSISLITDLGDGSEKGTDEFQTLLEGNLSAPAAPQADARSRIRSRLEGMVSL